MTYSDPLPSGMTLTALRLAAELDAFCDPASTGFVRNASDMLAILDRLAALAARTFHTCPRSVHRDWWTDTPGPLPCPWCQIDARDAERDRFIGSDKATSPGPVTPVTGDELLRAYSVGTAAGIAAVRPLIEAEVRNSIAAAIDAEAAAATVATGYAYKHAARIARGETP